MFPEQEKERKSSLQKIEELQELKGTLSKQAQEDKLMNSVLSGDKETLEEGKMIRDAINQGIGMFVPDMMFEQLVENYKLTKQLYGETLLREITGDSADYVEKNIRIPEYQRELKKRMTQKVKEMKRKKMLNHDGSFTSSGIKLASLSLYIEEIDHLQAIGMLGEKLSEKVAHYGSVQEYRDYKRGDRYRDISTRKSIKKATRRGHQALDPSDMKTKLRQAKGKMYLVYALDASGSMRGRKIDLCKKAGVALAYKAIQEHDEVGLIVFGKEVTASVPPTSDFQELLNKITTIRASQETDFAVCLREAIKIFPETSATKHLLLISDALPTVGEYPEKAALDAVAEAAHTGITVSLVGINLDKKGRLFGEQLTELGKGKFYVVDDATKLDQVVLMDYAQR